MKKVEWLDFTPDEFIDRVDEYPVCYMPCGFAEPHGVYNALGVDWYMAKDQCIMAAKRNGGIVAPPLAWHISEEPMLNWAIDSCGMKRHLASSIPNFLFMQNILYCLRAIDAREFKVVFFLSGHWAPGIRQDLSLLFEYYRIRTGSPITAIYGLGKEIVKGAWLAFENEAHAGTTETSHMMYFKPEITYTELFGTMARHPEIGGGSSDKDAYCAPKGFGTDPKYTMPSREIGEKDAIAVSDGLGKIAREILDGYDSSVKRPDAPDFYNTYEIWTSFERITSRYWKSSITLEQLYSGSNHPDFPGWEKFGIKK